MKQSIKQITACLVAVTVLYNFIGFHLGYEGLLLIGELSTPEPLQYLINFILLSINLFIIASVTWDIYGIKPLKILAPLLGFTIVSLYFHTSIITLTLIPHAYILIYAKTRKINGVRRWITVASAIIGYQLFALIYKLGYNDLVDLIQSLFDFSVVSISTTFYQDVKFSIDLIIFLIIIYGWKGVEYYESNYKHILGLVEWRQGSSQHIPTLQTKNMDELDEESRELNEWLQTLTMFKRIKAMSLLLGGQVMQYIFIFFVCGIGNVLAEGIAIAVSFTAYGLVIKKRWHSNSILICTLISASMFYIAAKAIPTYGYSQLFPIVVGLFLVVALYKVAVYTEEKESLENYVKSLSCFKLKKYCNREELLRIATAKKLTKKEIELLEWRWCRAASWAEMEVKFSPWSLSSIKRALKAAEESFLQ